MFALLLSRPHSQKLTEHLLSRGRPWAGPPQDSFLLSFSHSGLSGKHWEIFWVYGNNLWYKRVFSHQLNFYVG